MNNDNIYNYVLNLDDYDTHNTLAGQYSDVYVFNGDVNGEDTHTTKHTHSGNYSKDIKLITLYLDQEPDLPSNKNLKSSLYLQDFKDSRGTKTYKYNEYLILRLRQLCTMCSKISYVDIRSGYRFNTPTNSNSQHGKGCAVDIRFYDSAEKLINPTYIAVAAAWCGFGGIACLEAQTGIKTIHLDVRKDTENKCWYGYEKEDADNPGWFVGKGGGGSKYGDPTYFYNRYNLTKDEVEKYLGYNNNQSIGNESPQQLKLGLVIVNTDTDKVTLRVSNTENLCIDTTSNSNFIYSSDSSSEQQESVSLNPNNEFTLKKLIPGTSYCGYFEADSANLAMRVSSNDINFTTKQSYPTAGSWTSDFGNPELDTTKATAAKEYTVTFSIPENLGYWDDGYHNKGYDIFIVKNGHQIIKLPPLSTASDTGEYTITIIPADYGITFGSSIQIGLKTWIYTDKNETIYSNTVYTNPIYLISEYTLVKKFYIKNEDHSFIQAVITKLGGYNE